MLLMLPNLQKLGSRSPFINEEARSASRARGHAPTVIRALFLQRSRSDCSCCHVVRSLLSAILLGVRHPPKAAIHVENHCVHGHPFFGTNILLVQISCFVSQNRRFPRCEIPHLPPDARRPRCVSNGNERVPAVVAVTNSVKWRTIV